MSLPKEDVQRDINEKQNLHRNEALRIISFDLCSNNNWTEGKYALALLGFFLLNINEYPVLICAFCDFMIFPWSDLTDCIKKHNHGDDEGSVLNIPITYELRNTQAFIPGQKKVEYEFKEDGTAFPHMRLLMNRMVTWNGWLLTVNPEKFAKDGYFYDSTNQCACCFQCGGKYPISFEGNIFKDTKYVIEHSSTQSHHEQHCQFMISKIINESELPIYSPFTKMVNPPQSSPPDFYNSYRGDNARNARRRTFPSENSPLSQIQIDMLVKYGFIFEGVSDQTTCVYCGLTLSGWRETFNVFYQHAIHSPMCPHLKWTRVIQVLEKAYIYHGRMMRE